MRPYRPQFNAAIIKKEIKTMKTLQFSELSAISGGCFTTPSGEQFDIIEVAPGLYMPVPCPYTPVTNAIVTAAPAPRELPVRGPLR
jgi:hypothetical protein